MIMVLPAHARIIRSPDGMSAISCADNSLSIMSLGFMVGGIILFPHDSSTIARVAPLPFVIGAL